MCRKGHCPFFFVSCPHHAVKAWLVIAGTMARLDTVKVHGSKVQALLAKAEASWDAGT